jgi:hypothetical protein
LIKILLMRGFEAKLIALEALMQRARRSGESV